MKFVVLLEPDAGHALSAVPTSPIVQMTAVSLAFGARLFHASDDM